jgi:hypothetical protein
MYNFKNLRIFILFFLMLVNDSKCLKYIFLNAENNTANLIFEIDQLIMIQKQNKSLDKSFLI